MIGVHHYLVVSAALFSLGMLAVLTRRNAVSQIVGFMSLENGLILAATGAKGMPLVVEISVAFSVLVAFIVIGVFLFRIRERFDTVDVEALEGHGPLQGASEAAGHLTPPGTPGRSTLGLVPV